MSTLGFCVAPSSKICVKPICLGGLLSGSDLSTLRGVPDVGIAAGRDDANDDEIAQDELTESANDVDCALEDVGNEVDETGEEADDGVEDGLQDVVEGVEDGREELVDAAKKILNRVGDGHGDGLCCNIGKVGVFGL